MTKDNKDVFLKVLMQVKVPASNISRYVHMKEWSIWGLKSYDHHLLMQQLLPIAARRALPKNVVEALIEFTNFVFWTILGCTLFLSFGHLNWLGHVL